jgi:hypothetical protein
LGADRAALGVRDVVRALDAQAAGGIRIVAAKRARGAEHRDPAGVLPVSVTAGMPFRSSTYVREPGATRSLSRVAADGGAREGSHHAVEQLLTMEP